MLKNRIVENAKNGVPSFGVYVQSPSPKMIEFLGFAGLDYVRIDLEGSVKNIETVNDMVRTAHAVGVTPLVRVPEFPGDQIDSNLIAFILDMGALGIIIPRVISAEQVQEAVDAVKGVPLGKRKINTGGFTGGYGREDHEEHLAWANENVLLAVQVETREAVEAIDEIVKVPGLDIIQSGRGDLSYQYGLPGQQYHPTIVDIQTRVMKAGLAAGKLVSVTYPTLTSDEHTEALREYMRMGVQVLNMGSDRDIVAVYRKKLAELKS